MIGARALTGQPDWGPLYERHRDAMYGTARAVLRDRGLTSLADDAVQAAILSLMKSPPADVRNWEALLVDTAKKRALDILRSAPVEKSVELSESHIIGTEHPDDEERTDQRLDRRAAAKRVIDGLTDRERYVVAEYLLSERDRTSVAQDLGVTPARVSQIASSIQQRVRDEANKGGTE